MSLPRPARFTRSLAVRVLGELVHRALNRGLPLASREAAVTMADAILDALLCESEFARRVARQGTAIAEWMRERGYEVGELTARDVQQVRRWLRAELSRREGEDMMAWLERRALLLARVAAALLEYAYYDELAELIREL